MSARAKTMVVGICIGIAAGVATALAVLRFIPDIGYPVRADRLWRDVSWALFFSSPFGAIMGAASSALLDWRARTSATTARIVFEVMATAAVCSAIVTQMVLPVAWALPRGEITAIIVVWACVFGSGGSLILLSLFRPSR